MESLGVTLPTVKLNGKNYYDWVSYVEMTLGSEQRPTNHWDKRDKKAVAVIKLTISKEVFSKVRNEKSGVQVWDILKDLYQNSGDV